MNLLHFLPKDLNEKSLIREEDLLCPLNSKGTTGNLSSFTSYFQSESHVSSWAQGQAVSSGLSAFSPPCLHIPPRVHRTQPLPLLCTSLPWHPPFCPVLVSHRNPSPCVLKEVIHVPHIHVSLQANLFLACSEKSTPENLQRNQQSLCPFLNPAHSKEVLLI